MINPIRWLLWAFMADRTYFIIDDEPIIFSLITAPVPFLKLFSKAECGAIRFVAANTSF